MKTKVLLLYASYGNGHKAIANYIEDYLLNNSNDYEVLTIDLLNNTSKIMGSFSRKVGEKLILSKFPVIWEVVYRFFDNKVNSFALNKIISKFFDNKNLKKKVVGFNPDITIATHYFCSGIISRYNKQGIINSKLISIVTDHAVHEIWLKNNKYEDAIIVGNKEAERSLLRKGISKDKVKNFGIPISSKFYECDYDKEELLKKYNLTGKRKIILFFGGGGIGAKASLPYLKIITKKRINYDVIFIAGRNEELKEKAEHLVKKYKRNNIKVLGFVNYISELLYISDIVVTKPGGITITECLCLKRPMIIINKNAGQEKDNYKYLVRNGYAIKASNHRSFLRYLIYLEINPKILERMENRISKIEKNNAMENLFNYIEKIK